MINADLKPNQCWVFCNSKREAIYLYPVFCEKLYILFQEILPVGTSLFSFKMSYVTFDPLCCIKDET